MLQMPKRSLCDLVLDTIDIISARKNRPNLVRIYRHLHRLYDLSLSTCESLLQSLLKEGRVIRVTYKGNISYRNALKWKKYSYYMKKTMGSELPGTILTKAISELVVQEPDYLNMGVPCKILEEHLLSMKDYNISQETIHNLLQRELKHESLLQLDNGNYFLGPKPPDTPLFEGEEVDLKFDKVKKVKTYKHEIKRLKDKAMENMNTSNYILQNNNILESNKELSDLEEVNHSDIVTDMKGLDNLTSIDVIYSNDCKQKNTIIDENSSNPIIIKVDPDSEHFEDCIMNSSENGSISNEENHCSTKKLVGELQFRPLEELVEAESSSSQVMDSEPCDKNDNDKSPVEKTSNLASEERLSNESSDDSFSLSISDAETTNLERNLPSNVIGSSKDAKVEKLNSKPSSSQDECEISSEDTNNSKQKNSSCKMDSNSNDQKNGTSVYKLKNKDKSFPPVVERVQRKKRTKYDASEYYFPSLKRKTRESTSDNDKKEDKRRKKRKKDGVGCLSGIFAKRVMFPGNTSMCCECNCYISKVKFDPMIFCSTCANQGHQSCALKTMIGKDWYCVGCRTEATSPTCTVCNLMAHQEDRGILHCCTHCGDRFHVDCHSPIIKVPVSNEWLCFKCLVIVNSPNETEELPKNIEKTDLDCHGSQEFNHENKTNQNLQFLKEEPPDSRNWSSEDVYNYFKEYLDEEAASAFMEQDIDGYALKLMGRSDVLNLGLKVGSSLKVLFHVRRLQLRSNSLKNIWDN
ncbi:probable ATP-dependent helicase PF08_0048 [Halyomorpha halys]|uniref:probable ATP-dependent helicase PF08_0048 n=1 Tax=Halyomorpha halys TaxID=286706 RepID=UPI0006D4FA40|nr:chromodomain-helicase-DNA-binding protein 5-like [Halyomorpha halys]